MGQYYRPVNLDKKECLDPHKFNGGLKLMETCYVGNNYIDALTYLLANDWHGDRVILCGDYAWEDGGSQATVLHRMAESDPYESSENFTDRSTDFSCCNKTWSVYVKGNNMRLGHFEEVKLQGSFHIDAGHCRYVVDETAGRFYDREKAPVAWMGKTDGGEEYIARTDPLSIFMAVGNGLGGGDYHGPNEYLVGSWVGHDITAANEPPVGCTEIECPFDENGVFLTAGDDEIRRAMQVARLDWSRASLTEVSDAVKAVAALEKEGDGCDLDCERADARGASSAMEQPGQERTELDR